MIIIPAGPARAFVEATNRHDAEALLALFAPNATVTDDGASHTGSAEIRRWVQEHQIAPRITLDPTAYDDDAGTSVQLTASADGDFPGGPLPFAFRFTLDGDRIRTLEIHLAE
ncbi:nuclear transport factor 2 family protein [Curtobacterium sp. MCBD17_026]|uniref:nuclear transport factor 2 family protein n=1 Tax=Curtobacterium sp. MCBD17_026 TaxID=2175621 RepID=UPI000DA7F717|nr:nuclear transport factor 2 family protein [Curtobacterium sp. MCBD17_026]WIB72559.1 nuclear transport factor 2 family protein [Curtobacterium sp. MCBD17_026]